MEAVSVILSLVSSISIKINQIFFYEEENQRHPVIRYSLYLDLSFSRQKKQSREIYTSVFLINK